MKKEWSPKEFAEKHKGKKVEIFEEVGIIAGYDDNCIILHDYEDLSLNDIKENGDGVIVVFEKYTESNSLGWVEMDYISDIKILEEASQKEKSTSENFIMDYKNRFPDIKTINCSKECTVVVLSSGDLGLVRLEKKETPDVRVGILEAYIKAMKVRTTRLAFIANNDKVLNVKITAKNIILTTVYGNTVTYILSDNNSLYKQLENAFDMALRDYVNTLQDNEELNKLTNLKGRGLLYTTSCASTSYNYQSHPNYTTLASDICTYPNSFMTSSSI